MLFSFPSKDLFSPLIRTLDTDIPTGLRNMSSTKSYSTPDLVPDRTEELNARPFAEKKVSCLKQSFSIFHYLCSGISVFVQRRNLGTTGAEQPSPCLRSPKVGELLTLSPVWALDFPAQLISYLSIRKKSYFCRRVHYKQPPQQPRIMSDTSFEILP